MKHEMMLYFIENIGLASKKQNGGSQRKNLTIGLSKTN